MLPDKVVHVFGTLCSKEVEEEEEEEEEENGEKGKELEEG